MRIFLLLLSLFFYDVICNGQKKPLEAYESQRVEKIINSNWTFNYFPVETADKGYEAPGFNDSDWPAISLPHTWNTYETSAELHPFIRNASESDNPYWWIGWGWYRKHFSISSNLSGKKVFIEFEGVQKYCKVWINGKYLGDHKGGYGSFDFDITQYIKPGTDNVIAVAVNNRQKDNVSLPQEESSNFNVYSGIYRDVIIVVKNYLHIPMQGSANHEGGTFITVPFVSGKEGLVRVQTWVKNDNPDKRNCILKTSIIDNNQKLVQVIKTEAAILPGQLYKFDQTLKPVKNPHLWSHEDPYLYKVISEVTDSKTVTDTYISPLGFRWFRWDSNQKNLYLNGNKVVIWGGNRPKEYPGLGNAIPGWITVLDYADMAENLKYNFIRTANYPDDKIACDLKDKFGMVSEEKLPDNRSQDFSAEEQELQLREMIRRDRNHPSIMFWNIGETNHAAITKVALTEDTTRILSTTLMINPTLTTPPDNKGLSGSIQEIKSGEPARIILTSSQKKMFSDRGSIAIIKADIVDSNGNHVSGVNNTITWTLTGPASYIGPAVYESGMNKPDKTEGAWYISTPAINMIRSTGKSGKISIRAFASGLASGSLDIVTEDLTPGNSSISEPVLDYAGRKPVARQVLNVNRLDEVPRDIKLTSEQVKLIATDKSGYSKSLKGVILKNNPSVDTSSVEFRSLISLFSTHLMNNKGILTAEDYNFNVDHYNNCRLISGYINSTKLPPLFKETLRRYYSESIIMKGNEKNAGEEMNWLNWIPSGGTVVISADPGNITAQKGIIITGKTELADLIAVVYPQYVGYSAEAKERALDFITRMNPYIHVTSTIEAGNDANPEKIRKKSYKAEKDRPILIPLLKFISE